LDEDEFDKTAFLPSLIVKYEVNDKQQVLQAAVVLSCKIEILAVIVRIKLTSSDVRLCGCM